SVLDARQLFYSVRSLHQRKSVAHPQGLLILDRPLFGASAAKRSAYVYRFRGPDLVSVHSKPHLVSRSDSLTRYVLSGNYTHSATFDIPANQSPFPPATFCSTYKRAPLPSVLAPHPPSDYDC